MPVGTSSRSITVGKIPSAGDAKFCGHCAWGDHRFCPNSRCECADQNHEPDDRVAAAMRLYQRVDLTGDTRENLAAEWRGVTR